MLQVIDNQWKDHLLSMDELKQGIGNRAYGQKDPLVEYKKESYELFTAMMDRIEDETVRYLYFLQVTSGAAPARSRRPLAGTRIKGFRYSPVWRRRDFHGHRLPTGRFHGSSGGLRLAEAGFVEAFQSRFAGRRNG
jgi:hypothetical protein